MHSDSQMDLLADGPPPLSADRTHRALAAAERLVPRVGLGLPAAVQRALDGGAPRSAMEGIAAHVVRVVEALDGDGLDAGQVTVEQVHRRLPPVHGASPGIARAITAAIVQPDVEPEGPTDADDADDAEREPPAGA